jgi:hypothetical protein
MLRVWDTATLLEERRWDLGIRYQQIGLLPGGRMLAILAEELPGEVHHIDWMTGQMKQKREGFPRPKKAWQAHVLGPLGRLVAWGPGPGRLTLAEPGTEPLRQWSIQLAEGNRDYSAPVAFSPDGRYVAVGDPAGLILLLRLSERGVVPGI